MRLDPLPDLSWERLDDGRDVHHLTWLPQDLLGWVQLLAWCLAAGVLARTLLALRRFDQVALRLELMATQIHQVNRGSLKALQHARVLPSEHVGWPVPSTFPPTRPSAELIVDELLGRAHAAAMERVEPVS